MTSTKSEPILPLTSVHGDRLTRVQSVDPGHPACVPAVRDCRCDQHAYRPRADVRDGSLQVHPRREQHGGQTPFGQSPAPRGQGEAIMGPSVKALQHHPPGRG